MSNATLPSTESLNDPVIQHVRNDFSVLKNTLSVEQALAVIRERGVGERIVYFYVIDDAGRLVGVVPTRRLLTAPLDQRIEDVMIKQVIAIPAHASLLEACEFFVLHKFFAFPVVDKEKRVVGLVDVGLFTDRMFDIAEREQLDDVFETIGFHIEQVRDAAPTKAFKFRFPWMLATIASGTVCALLAGAFELTLAKSIILAFFLTLVLGLGESVSMQAMTVTIQSLRAAAPTLRWYLGTLRRELATGGMLGIACGSVVAAVAWIWRGDPVAAITIGAAILASIVMASFIGLSVPAGLHALKLDPKIAAGPVTLALTDICTLLFYFSLATLLLG
jgi:magnesium transporter